MLKAASVYTRPTPKAPRRLPSQRTHPSPGAPFHQPNPELAKTGSVPMNAATAEERDVGMGRCNGKERVLGKVGLRASYWYKGLGTLVGW